MHFYAVIIGTEILNGRREDQHFHFIKNELAQYGHELFASMVIKDDPNLIKQTFKLIQSDPESILFSFGGIGSTPDDLTREIASEVFRSSPVEVHQKFLQDIINRFGEKAYPHRIHMADLPPKSELLFNPINNMSGFSLDNRFFFTPGFPSMAHPMLHEVIKKSFSNSEEKFSLSLIANTSEETLISLMQKLPESIELSCLPMFIDQKPKVELRLRSSNKEAVEEHFDRFKTFLDGEKINYVLH